MIRKICSGLAGLLLMVTGCEDPYSGHDYKGKELSVEGSVTILSNSQSREWEDGDRIGVSVDGMSDYGTETNIAFDWNEDAMAFEPAKAGIVLKGSVRTLIAYYPFIGAENVAPSELTINTDESMQTLSGQMSNDFLFAKASATRENPVAVFDFRHLMSMMKINFVTDDGSSDELEYTLSGLVHKGRLDPMTGYVGVVDGERPEAIVMQASDMCASLLLIPQSAEVSISVLYKGKTYATVFSVALESDTVHEYTAKIGVETLDASLTIIDGGTADWVVGDSSDISSEEIEVDVNAGGTTQTRAVTDAGFRTSFEEGDIVGVYAVKDGAILPNVNNLPMTFDGAEWSFETRLNYNSSMQGAVFYAYYPYDKASPFEASASDPFASKLASWKLPYDISTSEKYYGTDLMTSSADVVEKNGKFTVTFDMVHRLGLVDVAFPKRSYTFTNTEPALKPYVISGATDIVINAAIGNEPAIEIKPYYEQASQTYRFLVRPDVSLALSGTFVSAGKSRKYSINIPDGIPAGNCRPYKIDGGNIGGRMEIKVGDYFCADGSLVSYDPNVPAPENAVGVVYMLGTTDQIESAHTSCTHAMVYALHREGSEAVYFGKAQNSTDWYSALGLDKNDYKDTDFNGYGYTSGLMRYAGDDGMMDNFVASIQSFRNAVVLPSYTTDWYLPSYNEFAEMAENESVLNSSLKHAGGEEVFEGTETGASKKFKAYWTSTLRSGTALCMYYSLWESDANNNALMQTGYVNGRYGYFRYAFAF